MFNVYDTLVIAKQGAPGLDPDLATEWSVDGNSYTFKLRTDVKFQSGNPLTADDVVFSLKRMQALGQGFSYLFTGVKDAVAVDANTVRFDLDTSYAPFLAAMQRLPIVDKTLVMQHLGDGDGEMKDWGAAWLSNNGAGSGAYSVASHNPQQETVMTVSYTHLDVYKRQFLPRHTCHQPSLSRDRGTDYRWRFDPCPHRRVLVAGAWSGRDGKRSRNRFRHLHVIDDGSAEPYHVWPKSLCRRRERRGGAAVWRADEHRAHRCLLYTSRCV